MGQPSASESVTTFLTKLQTDDPRAFEIVEELRERVLRAHPAIDEEIKYGGIMFSLATTCGGLYVSSKHVSFEFSSGYRMSDPEGVLQGTGKFRRHLKVTTVDEIDALHVDDFVDQLALY
jgi:hypothetical protein